MGETGNNNPEYANPDIRDKWHTPFFICGY